MNALVRVAEQELLRRLQYVGAVVIEGAKATGKTVLGMKYARSVHRLDSDANVRLLAETAPAVLLADPPPVLLDEWQLVPSLWNQVRHAVDAGGAPGRFLLAGSAQPVDDLIRHSGTGRFSRLRLRPLTGFERSIGSGAVSLRGLLQGDKPAVRDPGLDVPQLAELICHGGFPGHHHLTCEQAMGALRDYLNEIIRTDIRTVDGVARDPLKVAAVVAALARHVGTAVRTSTLTEDVATRFPDNRVARQETVSSYLSALERLWILEYQGAFAPHRRSATRLRSNPVVHLADPALAVAALGATPGALLRDINFMGLLFESMVLRDLRVFTNHQLDEVQHYRDESGLEVDAIVKGSEGRWAAFEIKLGAAPAIIDKAAASLLKFAARIDTTKTGEPAALVVITGSGHGYVRPDGVTVVPYGALAP